MKICFFASANSVHSYKWVSYFANIGWQVLWLSTYENKFREIKGVEFKQLRAPFLLALVDAWKILRVAKPTIVHAHYVGKYGLIAALSGFKPLIITAWGSDIIFGGSNFLKRPLVKFILKRASLITCDAIHMKNSMIKLGACSEKIKIVLFGIDTEKFFPNETKNNSIKIDSNNGSFRILSIRNFEKIYDIQSLIFAAEIITIKYPKVQFLLTGRGSEKTKLQSLIKKLNLQNNIKFSNYTSPEDMPKFYNSGHLCVSTSLSDAGIAGSTAEAMACGLPIVATNTGENNLWIEDDLNGFLVPPKNFRILAEKIIHLIESPKKRNIIAKNNREKIIKNNNYQVEMAKMKIFYEQIALKKAVKK